MPAIILSWNGRRDACESLYHRTGMPGVASHPVGFRAAPLVSPTSVNRASRRFAKRSGGEQTWRQQRRAHWIMWVTALTGLVGALTGLLAIVLRTK